MDERFEKDVKKLQELTEGIDFCMLTTMDGGHLRSRPMSTQQVEADGTIWFFTSDKTHKIEEIEAEPQVNAGYSKPDDNIYVSVSGTAEVSRDRAKMEELWSPILKAWFPDGLDDTSLCLLKINIDQAEYWESPSGKLVQLFGFVKALATGESADWGENKKIQM
jgi:general stress protein 26